MKLTASMAIAATSLILAACGADSTDSPEPDDAPAATESTSEGATSDGNGRYGY